MKKYIRGIIAVFALSLTCQSTIVAKAEYRYSWFGDSIPSQYSYIAEKTYNGKQLGIDDLNNPQDLFVDNEKNIYILDSGNNRIIKLNKNFKVLKIMDHFYSQNGEENILGAIGFHVHTDGNIYIADKDNQRVLVSDQDGNITRIIIRPESHLFTENVNFLPRKVIVDERGIVYILSENSNQGAYMIDEGDNFLGFYGRNQVVLTFKRVFELTLRKFASEEQREKMQNFIPVEFSNFDIDENGFIYTVTAYSDEYFDDEMIRKLNPLGKNILDGWYLYGDFPIEVGGNYQSQTVYTDVVVDENHFIYGLDGAGGKIFQYTKDGGQVGIFGGSGAYKGRFMKPVAIENLDGNILVLDNEKKNITVFEPTYFGELIIKGFSLFSDGYYKESKEYFEEIVKMDGNFDWAMMSLGRAYYEDGDFDKAKYYFERSNVGTSFYSEVKKELRNEWMREHFVYIFFGFILLVLLMNLISKLIGAKVKEMNIKSRPKEE